MPSIPLSEFPNIKYEGLPLDKGVQLVLGVKSPTFGDFDFMRRAVILTLDVVVPGRCELRHRSDGDCKQCRIEYRSNMGLPLKESGNRPTEEELRHIVSLIERVRITPQHGEDLVVEVIFQSETEVRFTVSPPPALGPVPMDFIRRDCRPGHIPA
jgi:hypothetical protein